MRLASLRARGRDGSLLVVASDGLRAADARAVAPSLQAALDDWDRIAPRLEALAREVEAGSVATFELDFDALGPPLPRAYEWIDGSAYLEHIRLVRRARGANPPPTLETDPLVYQGGSGVLLGPRQPFRLADPTWGLDFEAEVTVVLGDTPEHVSAEHAGAHIKLLMLVNDWTLRNLVPGELAKGFGFFCSKPASAFSPFAVTPDELGAAFRDGRVHLPLRVTLNGEKIGDPDAGAMHFSFFDLVAHVTKTRAFTAGTILGAGTASNADPARGVCCLAERRAREMIEHGAPKTPFLKPGDRVTIEMLDEGGRNVFGTIDEEVTGP
jgi:fumarylacetoacetate (FAA) hydrolase